MQGREWGFSEVPDINTSDTVSLKTALNALRQFWLVAGSRNSLTTSALNIEKIELKEFETLPALALKFTLEFDYEGRQLLRHDSLLNLIENCHLTTETLANCYELIASTAPAYDTRLASHILRKTYDLPVDVWDNLSSLTRVRSLAFNKKWSQMVDEFKFLDNRDIYEPDQGEVFWLYVRALHADNRTTQAYQLHRKLNHLKIPIPPDGQSFFDDHRPPEPECHSLKPSSNM